MKTHTTSNEPTFGVPENTTVIVEDEHGTMVAAFHDGDTWYEGNYDLMVSEKATKIQMAYPPVKLCEQKIGRC